MGPSLPIDYDEHAKHLEKADFFVVFFPQANGNIQAQPILVGLHFIIFKKVICHQAAFLVP